ncbi:uncharacterized protein EDB91DRAFT_1082664 [Suillus paluster]|uniref:uncharacterized protein n=1 Tax=Suillus paluster TaxID=48578 RepID=UPI001B85F073|nr:uncharacterized protein EDB91DRAFT_1082664 [Suillus paluster]KAG1738628.1 hypothetical protein EDB91DRAFT_1082664 [Suillus paluster]
MSVLQLETIYDSVHRMHFKFKDYTQLLLTTYEYIIKDQSILSKLKWVHTIIARTPSQSSRCGRRPHSTTTSERFPNNTVYGSKANMTEHPVKARADAHTVLPLQNNLPELWALLNFVCQKIFNSVKLFDKWFNTPLADSGTGDKIEWNEEEALLTIRQLQPMWRASLPNERAAESAMKKYKMIANGKDDKSQHLFLFESVEDKVSPTGLIDDKSIRSAGKLKLLSRILPKFFATGHTVLVPPNDEGWRYLRLHGSTAAERAMHVQQFNAKDSEIKVFILSTRAGSLGLNLQTTDNHVCSFDSDW